VRAAPVRIGLSATQKPLSLVATSWSARRRRLRRRRRRPRPRARPGLELPPVPLEAVMPNEVWERVYDRMAELAVLHRTTLIFVNTRRMAERVARHLATGWAASTWRRTTAAWPRNTGWTPSSA
jgi:ATP-dependent Lhr-like helicase